MLLCDGCHTYSSTAHNCEFYFEAPLVEAMITVLARSYVLVFLMKIPTPSKGRRNSGLSAMKSILSLSTSWRGLCHWFIESVLLGRQGENDSISI